MRRTPSKHADPLARAFRRPVSRWIRGAVGLCVLTALFAVAQPPQQDDAEKKQSSDAATAGHKHQVSDDTSRLLELATQLKAEIDKAGKDTLSINVIRKAESIEKLAKGVKEEMKHSSGSS